ncbi:hypothetical protein F9B85_00965 [Heliorestis acidaminivorans]|uniref:Uncharacterized protein n=1 Tax=Heliorestis acidaminivorans TaxID=553427 RepID=A0A6I0F049_9FIRM|nr:hypothetical protein [Heliorestis acidaminivorans]KAB2954296.1 hypothetical protein F9B85_00965 [Heliorestis acidaminivorans]
MSKKRKTLEQKKKATAAMATKATTEEPIMDYGAVTCPKCQSSNIKNVSNTFMALFVFVLGTLIFLLLAVIHPLIFLGAILPWAMALKIYKGKSAHHCSDCKNTWPVRS